MCARELGDCCCFSSCWFRCFSFRLSRTDSSLSSVPYAPSISTLCPSHSNLCQCTQTHIDSSVCVCESARVWGRNVNFKHVRMCIAACIHGTEILKCNVCVYWSRLGNSKSKTSTAIRLEWKSCMHVFVVLFASGHTTMARVSVVYTMKTTHTHTQLCCMAFNLLHILFSNSSCIGVYVIWMWRETKRGLYVL